MSDTLIKIRKVFKILRSLYPQKGEASFYVWKHVLKVRELAVFLVNLSGKKDSIEMEVLEWGALFHDIGRLLDLDDYLFHGIEGAKIIRTNQHFDFLTADVREKVALICERHVGCGIEGGYVPRSREELLVSFCDNLYAGTKLMGINWCKDRFSREISPRYGNLVVKQATDLEKIGFQLDFLY